MRLEFTTLLRQKKPGYDNNVVKEVKAMKERAAENGSEYILDRDYYIPPLMIGKYELLCKEFIKEKAVSFVIIS